MIDVAADEYYWYHFDALGNVIALVDDTADVVATYEYDVYGNATPSGNEHDNPYRFTGRRWDAESSLYYYRARMYNAEIGRFLQPDPIGYYDSMNLYQYCGNNPINWLDPYGLESEIIYGIMNPRNGTSAWRSKQRAEKATKKKYGRNGLNNISDAYRHAYWSADMARRLGQKTAKRIADAHEDSNPNGPVERKMDEHNNAAGRKAGSDPANVGKTIEEIVDDLIKNGDLIEYKGQEKPSEKECPPDETPPPDNDPSSPGTGTNGGYNYYPAIQYYLP